MLNSIKVCFNVGLLIIKMLQASFTIPHLLNNLHIINQASTNLFSNSTSFSYGNASSLSRFYERRFRWKIALALNTGGFPSNGGQDDDINGDTAGIGQTRLSRIVIAGGRQLLEKLNSARKNFPMKVFLLLLGFYTANALATILGQTGDWDVLVAGIVVAAVEGVGMLMYKRARSPSSGRLQSLIVLINYWKAGVCLGLFVDAFKLGS
ncbi:hypothetical protein KSS87_023714 [Heliosperma pusillum]|nr:hypothetical protein KSS87_008344 [Heliosperma pusillum]KAH9617009.1 hypothetical protein KSS87_023714 [Heliosperma pusillum]